MAISASTKRAIFDGEQLIVTECRQRHSDSPRNCEVAIFAASQVRIASHNTFCAYGLPCAEGSFVLHAESQCLFNLHALQYALTRISE